MESLIPAHLRDIPLVDNAGRGKEQYKSRRIRNKGASTMRLLRVENGIINIWRQRSVNDTSAPRSKEQESCVRGSGYTRIFS